MKRISDAYCIREKEHRTYNEKLWKLYDDLKICTSNKTQCEK